MFLYSTFTLVEYVFFAYFLFLKITSPAFKKIMGGLSIIFLLFITVYYFKGNSDTIDSIPIGFETILILVYSFYYLYEQTNDPKNLFIYSLYLLCAILGFMIYLSGSFFIYIFANQSSEALKYWYFTNIFSTLKDVLFIIAIIVNTHKSSSKLKNQFNLHYLN